jgi:beta-barrel assembly-enhancing protease
MDAERIAKTQEEINRILPARADYVITTSEYTQIRQRLMAQENKRQTRSDRPVLRIK